MEQETQKKEPIVYKVIEGLDTITPIFSITPKEINKSIIHYSEGYEMYVDFNTRVAEKSEYLIRTTVRSLKSDIEATYCLKPNKEVIRIGHGMCLGAFELDDGDNYEVEFSIIDSSGNTSIWIGDRIKFTKPTDKSYDDK